MKAAPCFPSCSDTRASRMQAPRALTPKNGNQSQQRESRRQMGPALSLHVINMGRTAAIPERHQSRSRPETRLPTHSTAPWNRMR
jgi:hypothetical protein